MIIIIQGYGQDNQGFEFREVQETFLFSKIPDRLRQLAQPLFNGYCGSFL
jgi:hypothetical protein